MSAPKAEGCHVGGVEGGIPNMLGRADLVIKGGSEETGRVVSEKNVEALLNGRSGHWLKRP